MNPDPIIEEIHRTREAIALQFHNDLRAICEDARRRQASNGHQVLRLPPKRPRPVTEPASQKQVG